VGNRGDKDHQNHHGEEAGSRQSEDEHVVENGRSDRGHRRNSHVEGDSYHGIRRDVGCRAVVDDHHSGHQSTVYAENEIEPDREVYRVESRLRQQRISIEEPDPYICNAGNAHTFEFTAVKFLYCGFKVRSSFELNKTSELVSNHKCSGSRDND
jgi:hypothetical protein